MRLPSGILSCLDQGQVGSLTAESELRGVRLAGVKLRVVGVRSGWRGWPASSEIGSARTVLQSRGPPSFCTCKVLFKPGPQSPDGVCGPGGEEGNGRVPALPRSHQSCSSFIGCESSKGFVCRRDAAHHLISLRPRD